MEDINGYGCMALLTGVITFFCSWAYCAMTYGFLLGFGLGWLPSMILGTIFGALWPVVWIVLLWFGYQIFSHR